MWSPPRVHADRPLPGTSRPGGVRSPSPYDPAATVRLRARAGRANPLTYVGFHLDADTLYFSSADDPGPHHTLGDGPADGEPLLYVYMTSDNGFPPL